MGRRPLMILLASNGAMFLIEVIAGWRAQSMGLVADGLDMGADAAVYLLALMAISASASRKLSAARFAGWTQLLLALGAFAELVRRAVAGSAPDPKAMVGLSLLALVINVGCLTLLRRHRNGEVHLQAAWIFSATDVQANLAVLCAGLLVRTLNSSVPDLIVGGLVTSLVLRGALRIRERVRREALELANAQVGSAWR